MIYSGGSRNTPSAILEVFDFQTERTPKGLTLGLGLGLGLLWNITRWGIKCSKIIYGNPRIPSLAEARPSR